MRRRLRAAAVGAALLLPWAVTGCGTEQASAAEIVRGAPAATVAATTARMTFAVSVPGVPGLEDASLSGAGAVDFERQVGEISFELGPLLQASDGSPPPGVPMRVDLVFEGTTYYLRFPMLAALVGGEAEGKEWVKIDGGAVAEAAGIDLPQLEQLGNDPRQQLAYLMGVSDDVEEVGEEEVRGEATTRYRGTASIDAVLERLGAQDAVVDADRFRRTAEQLGVDEVPFDVWIDAAGRVRRMRLEVPVPGPTGAGAGAGAGGTVEVVLEMYDFGSDVDVRPPAPEDTVDVTALATGAGG